MAGVQAAAQARQADPHLRLANRIRQWRAERSISQAELAERAGFARSTLSKVENGQLSPTFEILLRIAHGFGVELSELVRPEGPAPASRLQVVRGIPENAIEYANHRLHPLADRLKGRRFQSAIVTFTTTEIDKFGDWNQHATEDMLFVLLGTLVFHSDGWETLTLEPGDSIHFDGAMRHACVAAPPGPCTCLYAWHG